MRRATFITVIALAVAALALWSVPSAAQTELHLVRQADASRYQLLDLGRPGFRLGDREAIRGPVLDATTSSRVGTMYLDCAVMKGFTAPEGGLYGCREVVHLRDGDLVLDGLEPHGPGTGTVAVIGGTGAYAGMTGEATVTQTEARTGYDIQLSG